MRRTIFQHNCHLSGIPKHMGRYEPSR